MSAEPRIAVVGLGNVLMGDDAFGPWVVQALLAEHEFPADVAVLDLGTPGLDLTPYITGLEALVLVDTVLAEAAPGALRLYRRDDILRHPPPPRLSPHDPGVKEALLTAEFAGVGPREVLLVGVVPALTGTGVGLSGSVRAAIPTAVGEVRRELERLGAHLVPRSEPLAPDVWWEAAVEGVGPVSS